MINHHATESAATASHGMGQSPARLALSATLHCLTGCGIGEVLGLVIGTALGWGDVQTIVLAVTLAFVFGYGLTLRPLLAGGLSLGQAFRLAFAADTLSITTMEIVDNAIILAIPGAMDAGLSSFLFWGSLAVALAIAFAVTYPLNLWLISRGKGHAVVHGAHHAGEGHGQVHADSPADHHGHSAHTAG
jgi:hypothetical protein